jgi:hypothetical protein
MIAQRGTRVDVVRGFRNNQEAGEAQDGNEMPYWHHQSKATVVWGKSKAKRWSNGKVPNWNYHHGRSGEISVASGILMPR